MRSLFALVLFALVSCQNTNTQPPASVYAQGLEVWRKPLNNAKFNVTGVSCSSCHGADMIDLAAVGVRDTDIRRRGLEDGLTNAEVEAVIAAVQGLRSSLNIKTVNPDEFRPFQPGGAILPGADNTARDIVFGQRLATITPTLMSNAPINSLEAAKRAKDELLAINLRQLQVGIPMPRWSEDKFHNPASVAPDADRGTMNDWVADLPRVAGAQQATWLQVQDTYLADPSPPHFWAMYLAVPQSTEAFSGATARAANYGLQKFRSALIGQHLLRAQLLEQAGRGQYLSDFLRGNPTNPNAIAQRHIPWAYLEHGTYKNNFSKLEANGTFGNPKHPLNDVWDVADQMRDLMEGGQDGQTPAKRLETAGFPKFVGDGISSQISDFTMKQQMAASWFWLSFTLDASLRGAGGFAAQGHYFAKTMNSVLNLDLRNFSFPGGSYRVHGSFMHAMRFAVQGFVPESNMPNQNGVYPVPSLDLPGMKDFWMPNEEQQIVLNNNHPLEQRQLFGQFTTNALLMMTYLYEEALQDGRAKPYAAPSESAFVKRFNTMVGCVKLGLEAYRPAEVEATRLRFEAMRVRLETLGAKLPKLPSYPCDAYYP